MFQLLRLCPWTASALKGCCGSPRERTGRSWAVGSESFYSSLSPVTATRHLPWGAAPSLPSQPGEQGWRPAGKDQTNSWCLQLWNVWASLLPPGQVLQGFSGSCSPAEPKIFHEGGLLPAVPSGRAEAMRPLPTRWQWDSLSQAARPGHRRGVLAECSRKFLVPTVCAMSVHVVGHPVPAYMFVQ